MTKKIAVINDLSGFGRCSLTAAIPVIAAMGVQPCPLPTAILSAQTGYPSYFLDDYTEKMECFRQEWEAMDVKFDGIYTGFVASEYQINRILDFIKTFRVNKTFLLVDPVMGDNGKAFPFLTEQMCERMKELALSADVIIPNLTELCLLTGTDYRMIVNMTDEIHLRTITEQLAENLIKRGPKTVLVTGIRFVDDTEGSTKIGNLAVNEKGSVISVFPYIGGSYSGTGDLFASVIAAGVAKGMSIETSMELAGRFIKCAIEDTVKENVPRNEGVNYEQYLGMLTNFR